MIRAIIAINVLLLFASDTIAQHPSVRKFEVASIRPHQGLMPRIDIGTAGTRLNAEAESVRGLIMYAYNLKHYQVIVTRHLRPIDAISYDIRAKAEGDRVPTDAEFRHMLQSLLADRFKLKIRRETRDMPVYELVVGKNRSEEHT